MARTRNYHVTNTYLLLPNFGLPQPMAGTMAYTDMCSRISSSTKTMHPNMCMYICRNYPGEWWYVVLKRRSYVSVVKKRARVHLATPNLHSQAVYVLWFVSIYNHSDAADTAIREEVGGCVSFRMCFCVCARWGVQWVICMPYMCTLQNYQHADLINS